MSTTRKPITRDALIDLLRDWLHDDESKDTLRKFAWEQLYAISAPDTSEDDAPFEMPPPEIMDDPAALAAYTMTCLGRLHAARSRKR